MDSFAFLFSLLFLFGGGERGGALKARVDEGKK